MAAFIMAGTMQKKAGTGVSREGCSQWFTPHWRNCFMFAFLAVILVLSFFAMVHTSKAVVFYSQLQQSQAELSHHGLRSAFETSSSVCQGEPKIFVYDNLPADFNTDLLVPFCEGEVEFFAYWCEALCNGGLGKQMSIQEHPTWEDLARDSEHKTESVARLKQKEDLYESLWMSSQDLVPHQAWYHTEQMALELLFHERMKVYPCQTKDPEQASIFYIPFYATLDVSRHLSSKWQLRDRLFQRLIGWLMAQEPWLRFPHKHMFVLGRIVWDFARMEEDGDSWGNSLLRQPELGNSIKVLIEQSMEPDDLGRGQMAVPYPTAFHPASDSELQEWRATVEASRRDSLVSFIGGRRNVTSDTAKLRDIIFSQCQSHPECTLLDCADFDCLRHHQYLLSLALRSVFCLQPEGDSPTRRAIFDSLVAGCIPVFFTGESAYRQYLWHLPANSSSWSVFIPEQEVRDGLELVPVLSRIPIQQVRAMQRAVFNLLPDIVYSMPGRDSQRTFSDAFDLTPSKPPNNSTGCSLVKQTGQRFLVSKGEWQERQTTEYERLPGPHPAGKTLQRWHSSYHVLFSESIRHSVSVL